MIASAAVSLANWLWGMAEKLLLVSLSLGVALIALELGLRLFWGGFYLKDAEPYATGSETRGWRNLPDTVARRGEPEFVFTASHDALGHRTDPGAAARPAAEKRVFVLGDSFAYGIGVQDDETFCARLEQLDPRLDAFNGGVTGYGTGQELLQLRDEGEAVQPDAVVIAFFWNDVGNSYNRDFPHFQLVDGELREPGRKRAAAAAPPRSERREYLRHSYAYRFISDRLKMSTYAIRLMLGFPVESADFVSDAERDEAWALTRELVRAIRDEAERLGAHTLVAIIPDQVQVEPDVQILGLDAADYEIQDRMFEIGAAIGLPVIDLRDPLRADFEAYGQRLYFRKDRHLTVRGNRVVARALQQALDGLLFGSAPRSPIHVSSRS